MKYKSTRGQVTGLSFEEAVLSGLADDGGLLIPEDVPQVTAQELSAWRGKPYNELAFDLIRKFIDPSEIPDIDLQLLVNKSYTVSPDQWRAQDIVPVHKLNSGIYVMELFHGPTFAFKDIALQFLGNLFSYILQKRNQRMVILGATSGDTGSAAIYGVKGKPNIDCVILYPNGRTSKIQELQMTTVPDENIRTLALDGTFDDCQDIVKASFNSPLKQQLSLGAVNSINFARILAQIVYYGFVSLKLTGDAATVSFSVPTGNFGDILAGYYAKRMGFPIETLIVASNSNDVLTRFFQTGVYHNTGVSPTMSPSMDIAISSNFERFLYDVLDGEALVLAEKMQELKSTCRMEVTPEQLRRSREVFASYSVDEASCAEAIRDVFTSDGYTLCPHSAIGYAAALNYVQEHPSSSPMVTLATAHYGKFIEEMDKRLSTEHRLMSSARAAMPEKLQKLQAMPSRKVLLGATNESVAKYLLQHFGPQPRRRHVWGLVVGAAVVGLVAWYAGRHALKRSPAQ